MLLKILDLKHTLDVIRKTTGSCFSKLNEVIDANLKIPILVKFSNCIE